MYNDGTQIRSWCYVSDFIDALEVCLFTEIARNEVFNIGNPQATTTVLGLAESILRLTGSSSKIVFKPHPGPEVEVRVPDVGKAADLLGFRPKVGLDEGLNRTFEWFKETLPS